MRRHALPTGLLATLLVALLVVSACTSSGGSDKPSGSAAGSRAGSGGSATKPASASSPPVQNPVPTSVANKPALRPDVMLKSCGRSGAGWQAAGRITNHGKTAHKYVITIYFTTRTATVQDFAATSVKVSSGKSADWRARKSFRAASGTQCVLRGVG